MFAELLARSCFSFLRGASHPEELVERAAELSLSSLALVDRDGLYGVVRGFRRHRELVEEGHATGLRYHIGTELILALPRRDAELPGARPDEYEALSVALLVQTAQGYTNLCRLISLAHAEREKGQPASELDFWPGHTEGLFLLIIPPARPRQVPKETTERLLETARRTFADRAAVAIYRHKDGFDRQREAWARQCAKQAELPLVATARPSYHSPERKPLGDIVHCIRRGLALDEAGSELDGSSECYLKSEAQMLALFRDHPEWVAESGRIAESLRFELSELQYRFPCDLPAGQNPNERLRELVRRGEQRYFPDGTSAELRAQIDKELSVIAKIDVAPYFLSTLEVVEIARQNGILCQGRGSAANSAVCYLLDITAVPPSSNALFERFLSEERKEPPDIDVDFEHERREEVIQALYERHGRERAAMVSEVISYRTRSALRDVAKVFGLGMEQAERLSQSTNTWSDEDSQERALASRGFSLQDPRVRQTVAWARQLCGFPRHLSIHVGGFVLSAEPLYAVAPIEAARMENRTVVPWDKDDIDTLGFYKVDVLGLGMLTAVRKALSLTYESGGLKSERDGAETPGPLELLKRIPQGDEATYDMICRAETIGVFQIESRAQMSMLPRLRPRTYYDLVIQVAIVRPGPIQGGMVHPFLRRRRREEPADPPHPRLAAILERTLGVPLFQEQVMQIAIVGAGYSGGEADQLRRDMAAWKKHGKLLAHRERLLTGFAERGIARVFGEALFEQIKGFGEYGFPESHAAAFALIVYASAWLKAHFPAQFTCALLNSQPLGFYAPTTLVRDAQKQGVRVHDVCAVESHWDSTLSASGELRLGLRLIRGLREEVAHSIVTARQQRPFASLGDFSRRSGAKKNELAALAAAGALSALEPERKNALWRLEAPRTPGLFEHLDAQEPEVSLTPLRPVEQLMLDYAQKGLSVNDHPLRYYRRRLRKIGATRAADLPYLPAGKVIFTAGLVLNRQRPATASGVVFMTLEDETGIVNLILQASIFERFEAIACQSALLLVRGRVEREQRAAATEAAEVPVIHVLVSHIDKLSNLKKSIAPQVAASSGQGETDSLNRLSRNFH